LYDFARQTTISSPQWRRNATVASALRQRRRPSLFRAHFANLYWCRNHASASNLRCRTCDILPVRRPFVGSSWWGLRPLMR